MTQEELENLEKQVALEGNEDAVKRLVDYYESNGNLEKANQYKAMLVDENSNAQNQVVSQQSKQKVISEEQIDLVKFRPYAKHTENQYNSMDYNSLKEEAEYNPFSMIFFANKCKSGMAYDDAVAYYNKALDILNKINLYYQDKYDSLCNLAETYMILKKHSQAFNAYSNAYEIKEEHTINDECHKAERGLSNCYEKSIGCEFNQKKAVFFKNKYLINKPVECIDEVLKYYKSGEKLEALNLLEMAEKSSNQLIEAEKETISFFKVLCWSNNESEIVIKTIEYRNALLNYSKLEPRNESINHLYPIYKEANQIIDNEYYNYKKLNEEAKKKLLYYAFKTDYSESSRWYIKELIKQIHPELSNDLSFSYLVSQLKPYIKTEESCLDDLEKAYECFEEKREKDQEQKEERRKKTEEQRKKKEKVKKILKILAIVLAIVAIFGLIYWLRWKLLLIIIVVLFFS